MDAETYRRNYRSDDAPGWSAIDIGLNELYPGREPDRHLGTIVKYALGGPGPLDGISIYRRADPYPHLHYVSYGMSELYYDEEAAATGISKWGFEFTFRLRITESESLVNPSDLPIWPADLMQNLARYVNDSGKWFEDGHFLKSQGPIKAGSDTEMVGLLFVLDPELGKIATPHGDVDFLQIVGLTERESDMLFDKTITVSDLSDRLKTMDALMITNLERTDNSSTRPDPKPAPATEPDPAPTPQSPLQRLLDRFRG